MLCHNCKMTCPLSRSVADLDTGLVDHLAELRLTNSRAQEFPSIEQLEASTGQAAPRHASNYAAVRGSLYQDKSRTWSQVSSDWWRLVT